MLVDTMQTFSTPTDNYLLEACLSLADAASLVELERRLADWLGRLYAPKAWSVIWPTDVRDEPIIEMQGGPEVGANAATENDQIIQLLLQAGPAGRGTMTLQFDLLYHVTDDVLTGLKQIARVLSNRLSRVHLELKSLAQTAELFFVRSLLHGNAPAGVNRNLDGLANTLLVHLNVSSFQVLVDEGSLAGLSWGVSSRRLDLSLSHDDRQKLMYLTEAVFRDARDETPAHLVIHRAKLRSLEQQYDLPYLSNLQSMLIVPICQDNMFVGAVIAGEQRHWSRQPISRQAITISSLIAQSVAEAVTQSRLMAKMIERVQSMQALIDGLGDAVLTARNGAIVSWNRAAQKLFGYSSEEVLGRSMSLVFPNAPVELHDSRWLTSLLSSSEPCFEWKMETTDGRGLHLACAMSHLYDSDTSVPLTMYVLKDIGQEQELEYLKEELLSSVSHELRTPLNGIYGFSRLLLDRPHLPDDMRREALESLQSSVERLTRLTNDFIDVARARRHRLPIELDYVAIDTVVRSAVREQKRRHTEHKILLRIQKDLPAVRGDSMRIKQILDNLVSNAAKYSPEGTTICIYVRRQAGMIAISVSDHGVGIPEAVQERVFEPFYRADNSRSQRANGVGLGLSIVKSLVLAHDGHITVQSKPERGSTFTFTLPLLHDFASVPS